MSGYSGYSKSNNAVSAERENRYPLTHAVNRVATATGCTQKAARAALKVIGPIEWHHTSKHYNKTDFYDVDAAVRYIEARPLIAGLPHDWQERMGIARSLPLEVADRMEQICAADAELSALWGVSVDVLTSEYYDCWES